MLMGAIAGDIIGSVYEFRNIRTTEFPLFSPKGEFTDDSVLTIALAKAILDCKGDYSDLYERAANTMHEFGRKYTGKGYGGRFQEWLYQKDFRPYNSCGNGAAMRVSAAGWAGKTEEEVKFLAEKITSPTHNHPEGLKGAEATALAVFLARTGASKEEIKRRMSEYYSFDQTVEEIRKTKTYFDSVCQETVPQALTCFFESVDYEDCVRNCISITGDSDTLAAIAGAVAEAFYGVPEEIVSTARGYFEKAPELLAIVDEFTATFGEKR